MKQGWQGVVSIIDRPGGADSDVLVELQRRVRVQRLLPEEIATLSDETEVILIRGGFWTDLPRLLELAPKLKWIHVNMSGVEQLDLDFLRNAGVGLTNSSGVLDRAIAEFVLGATLLWSKGLHRSVLETQQRIWAPREPIANASLRVLIVGAGGIGSQCAALFQQAGFGHVSGVRRSAGELGPAFDERVPLEALSEVLPSFDVVVCCLPGSAQTAGLFDESMIGRLKQRMVLINVGRGSVLDQNALAAHLARHPEMLAVLDVTDPEPLPVDHPLRWAQNLVLSPHMAGETVERHDNFSQLFVENLGRYIEGETLLNTVVPLAPRVAF